MRDRCLSERTRAPWSADFDRYCGRLIEHLLTPSLERAERDARWRELIALVGPHVEAWARQSFVLRRYQLATEDDARTVLVATLGRLHADEFANLRTYLSRCPPGTERDRVETDTLVRLARLSLDDVQAEALQQHARAADDAIHTPLRAWLLTLLGYVIKDHVRQRLGWAREPGEAAPSKRDVNTNADRLEVGDVEGERPPVSDWVTMTRFIDEVNAFIATFPADMRAAIKMWLEDADFDEIATRLGDGITEKRARDLVRAGKARLREQFRDDWDRFGGQSAA